MLLEYLRSVLIDSMLCSDGFPELCTDLITALTGPIRVKRIKAQKYEKRKSALASGKEPRKHSI